jgi:hypothetical protein
MLLFFMNECKTLKLSALEYFELAYLATFGRRHPNVGLDYAVYLTNSKLPQYVLTYIQNKTKAVRVVNCVICRKQMLSDEPTVDYGRPLTGQQYQVPVTCHTRGSGFCQAQELNRDPVQLQLDLR